MKKTTSITRLFRDIGGVGLTDGRNDKARNTETPGIRSSQNPDFESTRARLAAFGLKSPS